MLVLIGVTRALYTALGVTISLGRHEDLKFSEPVSLSAFLLITLNCIVVRASSIIINSQLLSDNQPYTLIFVDCCHEEMR